MKIKIGYNLLDQSEYECGAFVFIRDGDKIRNLEAIW